MAVQRVTRDNFEALLPDIRAAIDAADFLAFDTELTGLSAGRAQQYSLLDTPQERYSKVRHGAMNYGLLQYGLAAFRYDPQAQQWASQAWAFYLWPATGTSAASDRNMLVQLSSIEFLVRFGYDFNLTFSKGLSYLSRADERHRRGALERSHALQAGDAQADVDIDGLGGEDARFLAETLGAVARWAAGGAGAPLLLEPCNGFRRRLLHQELPKRYGRGLVVTKEPSARAWAALRLALVPEADREAHAQQALQASLALLEHDVGFGRIIEHVCAAGKPFVGHNCFTDLCHTFQKFFDRLPEDYAEFKGVLHGALPLILDTKYVAAALQELHGAESTSLGDLVHLLAEHPAVRAAGAAAPAADGDEGAERFHDAGYDALCTGRVLLGLCALVAGRSGQSLCAAVQSVLAAGPPHGMANRLFMMQSDSDGFVLGGPERAPDRSAVCHLSGFDPALKTAHIQAAAAAAGLAVDAGGVVWISEGALFLRFRTAEDAGRAAALRHLPMPQGQRATMVAYDVFCRDDKLVPEKRRLSGAAAPK